MDILSVLIMALFLLMALLIGIFIAYARSQRSKSKTEVVRKNLYGERSTTRRQQAEQQKRLTLASEPRRQKALTSLEDGNTVKVLAADGRTITIRKHKNFIVETPWELQSFGNAEEALSRAEYIFDYMIQEYKLS